MIGNEIVARCLTMHGVDIAFYLMGAPMLDCEAECERIGMRMIDVRHEQAAPMMATAYARLRRRPAACMAASGPGVMNLVTGVANAFADGTPVIVLGGASPVFQSGMGAFQEVDQLSVFRPITRWSERCYQAERLPEYFHYAFEHALGSAPGPVYLDLPGDVLYANVDEAAIQWMEVPSRWPRPQGDPESIDRALDMMKAAERPVLLSGSGILWSEAEAELRQFVERSGIPFYATPQGRGAIPEAHDLSFLGARSEAFGGTDLIVLAASRQNYVSEFTRPPRWNKDAKLVQIDIDAHQIGRNRPADVGIVGDAGAVLRQLLERDRGHFAPGRYAAWTGHLEAAHEAKARMQEERQASDAMPIHPLRLCREVREFLSDDAVLCVDGQEILTYARQSIPFQRPHSLNSGPFGCMGVGLPLALGAKVARPEATVLVLHGDGSFGINAMELDTAVRHDIPIVCVISNNAGWTAQQEGEKVSGQHLGFTRYDEMFEALGCYGEMVEDPNDIRPALERALASGRPAVVNVMVDPTARGMSTQFTRYET
ncbi:MAG: hypothetical protein GEV09_09040 [Pseudonocardiaceae bacterium]|nr:hypothetical protein [Pseudonocardiaceae bacterium]